MFLPCFIFAQTGELRVESFHLANGMKVMVCEDHSAPEIFGGVLVRVGSKNDPAEATGMAHYFEHIMFKGTDQIGTVNWDAEKVYLDSISWMYDKLHETTDEDGRKAIQQEINRLTIASAQYAIPNEMDQILSTMGGKGINAYTNHDVTVYYNRFPSNQLEKWMEVYFERFRSPVFRLFQSELETVYEEKNMYADNPFERAFEDLMKEVFGEHPYSRPILGYTQHLKNPQISKMQHFFDTYYVPENMVLVLTGDVTLEEAQRLAETTFGKLEAKPLAKEQFPPIPTFKGRQEVNKRLTPVKAGVLGYITCTAEHEDYYKVKLLSSLFSNNANSGLVDQLGTNSELYMSMVLDYKMRDVGLLGFVYVPKIIGQSLNKTEKLVMDKIDSVKKGHFSDQLFEAVKMELLVDMMKALESPSRKFNLLLSMETEGGDWQGYNKALRELSGMTKQEVVAVANRYLGDDYIAYRTRMGFPKKEKIEKPDWQPITAANADHKSEYAQKIEAWKVEPVEPQHIYFEDVKIEPLKGHYQLLTSENPYNDIFRLELNFYHGTNHNPEIAHAVEYFNRVGTETKPLQQFLMDLQQLGGSMNVSTTENYFIITIEGFESNFEPILALCSEKFKTPQEDPKMIKNMIGDQKMNYRMYRFSPSNWSHPLFEYMVYGEYSTYLNCPGLKEMKDYTPSFLIQQIKEAVTTSGYITYVGNENPTDVATAIEEHFPLASDPKNSFLIGRPRLSHAANELYCIHSGRVRQSNIYFYRDGIKYADDQDLVTASCFNKYFGQDMFSIVFQEIREFRSLGYSASALYQFYHLNVANGFLYGRIGTQSDKTIDAMTAMKELMLNLPQKPEKFETAKEALIQTQRSSYISFRNIPEQVYFWMLEGREGEDPRGSQLTIMQNISLEDVNDFYNKTVGNNPLLISFVGNTRKITKKELSSFGNIRKVKFKDVFKK